MSDRVFNVGICGTGTIGAVHANAIRQIPNATLVATAEPKIEDGKDFAEEFGAKHYPSLQEMLQHPDLDVVIVTSPSGMHPDHVVTAAKAGKMVISEKPMGITPEGIDRMIGACEDAGVPLAVMFQNRLNPDVLKTKHAIEDGHIGTPIMANGAMYWKRTDSYYAENDGWRGTWALDGGGALMNQAIHTVDMLQFLMGGITSIQAHTATLTHDIECEDTAAASFTFGNGALGTIVATTSASKDYPVRVEIIGTKGRITLELNEATLWDVPTPIDDIQLTPDEELLVAGAERNEEFGVGHRRQLQYIFNAFANGTDPYVMGRNAREAVDIILGIYESAKTGTRVDR